jgi:aquaporin Z
LAGGLAANGFGDHSPGNYSMAAGFVCEAVMTAIFLFVIISIPVTNTSVNPARSTAPAIRAARGLDPSHEERSCSMAISG